MGYDENDNYSRKKINIEFKKIKNASLTGKRFGVFKSLLREPIYKKAIKDIKEAGGIIIEFDPPKIDFSGFRKILDVDMKKELPEYLSRYAKNNIEVKNISDIINFNLKDSIKRAPYGQGIFEGIVSDNTSKEDFKRLKVRLKKEGQRYFVVPLLKYNLDVILSINNYHAAYAAAAHYPCLTVPMGYRESGIPTNLTFIGPSFSENKLYQLGFAYEKETKNRIPPIE
jgi:amidase